MIGPSVNHRQEGPTPGGGIRAISDWQTGAGAEPPGGPGVQPDVPLPARIGRFAIDRCLGHGGMGVVYAARDDRLQRTVALKTLSTVAGDDSARLRLWREARAAASVNHPNVCQIYEVGEDEGRVFIAMELLEGEPLTERLRRGPLVPAEALAIALDVLAALSALHDRGIVHRDLKPSNVFLTPHGVKLLDFGLARTDPAARLDDHDLTRPGIVMGTPRYMSPEQVTGDPVDARSDLFAAGAILFEMLAGRPAFNGRTLGDVLYATQHEQPPALVGSPAVAAIDRVIRRAMAKRPDERPASAAAMADELRALRTLESGPTTVLARPLTRLVVLPFRVLRPDTETDFLAFSLPDAIATSLAANPSLVVRSSAVAARLESASPDLKALAADADVDRVVMGTLLRAGDRLRVAVQLIEVPSGTLLTAHAVDASLGDLFRLQDDIAGRVTDALAPPLTATATWSGVDMPADARAYELYLRANELSRTYSGLMRAREVYEHCLELDSRFAPAWAHLGRCHRVIGKYVNAEPDSESRAEEALRRALRLNPRLTVAHKFYAQLESDVGRAIDAVVRLLGEASRHGNDPELFAGLVHACRYCGLFEQSIAAHEEARRLDPNVPSGLDQTLLMAGATDQLLSLAPPLVVAGADDGIRAIALAFEGRRDEAKARLLEMRTSSRIPLFAAWVEYLLAWINRRPVALPTSGPFGTLRIHEDPEAMFQEGWIRCDLGEYEVGLAHMRRAVDKGYFPVDTLATRRQFDAIRDDPRFQELVRDAEAGRQRALAAFREAGGERLLR